MKSAPLFKLDKNARGVMTHAYYTSTKCSEDLMSLVELTVITEGRTNGHTDEQKGKVM